MARKKVIGTCHICGTYGPLSFEHVPPEKAFNDKRIVELTYEQVFEKLPGELPTKGKIEQRGAGGYTLCERCNSNTGSWYANDFIDWTIQGMRLLIRSGGKTSLYYPFYIFPLRVIKQIITMFFSVNRPEFQSRHPELVKFVLNREVKYLPKSIRVYCSLMVGRIARSSGVSVKLTFNEYGNIKNKVIMSEIAYPPFIYVMTFDSPLPDDRLTDITWFSRYEYKDFNVIFPQLNVLPVNYYLPGDYRTVEQMLEDRRRNLSFD